MPHADRLAKCARRLLTRVFDLGFCRRGDRRGDRWGDVDAGVGGVVDEPPMIHASSASRNLERRELFLDGFTSGPPGTILTAQSPPWSPGRFGTITIAGHMGHYTDELRNLERLWSYIDHNRSRSTNSWESPQYTDKTIDPFRMLELWAASWPVGCSRWINELPIRSNMEISRSRVPSPRPAAAAMTRHSNPRRPGPINDKDQPSHRMINTVRRVSRTGSRLEQLACRIVGSSPVDSGVRLAVVAASLWNQARMVVIADAPRRTPTGRSLPSGHSVLTAARAR